MELHFEANGDGIDVTESFELNDVLVTRLYRKLAEKARTRTNTNNMQAALERIKAVAELPEGNG